jgi:hypothetical protein
VAALAMFGGVCWGIVPLLRIRLRGARRIATHHLGGAEVFSGGVAFNEREVAQVGAIKLKNVKRQMHRPIVLRATVEGLEVADAVLGQPDDLAIQGDGFRRAA